MLTHFIFEALGYFIGAQIYWQVAKRFPNPPTADRLLLLGCAIFGAFLGSKLLHILEHLPFILEHKENTQLWLSGKSVLGGFIGGTFAVELGKKIINWKQSTGDAWVLPLAVGLMIGRIGCQLSGLNDLTYGIATNLPWGWDYGEGILRHPTGFYEIILVGLLTLTLYRIKFTILGRRFDFFMAGYCLIRLFVDFLKPPFGGEIGLLPVASYFGLSAIQWVTIFGCVYYCYHALYVNKQSLIIEE